MESPTTSQVALVEVLTITNFSHEVKVCAALFSSNRIHELLELPPFPPYGMFRVFNYPVELTAVRSILVFLFLKHATRGCDHTSYNYDTGM